MFEKLKACRMKWAARIGQVAISQRPGISGCLRQHGNKLSIYFPCICLPACLDRASAHLRSGGGMRGWGSARLGHAGPQRPGSVSVVRLMRKDSGMHHARRDKRHFITKVYSVPSIESQYMNQCTTMLMCQRAQGCYDEATLAESLCIFYS